jgi:hypothetical protein
MPGIEILLMSQRMEIRDGKEDWTGNSSIAEKRKLQNRLNQRAYRNCTYSLRGRELINIRSKKDPGKRTHLHGMHNNYPTSS